MKSGPTRNLESAWEHIMSILLLNIVLCSVPWILANAIIFSVVNDMDIKMNLGGFH